MRIATFAVALLAGLALAAPASAAPPANTPATVTPAVITEDGLCDVTVTHLTAWSNGYIANIAIKNISAFPVTWRATLTLPPGGYVSSGWGATVTQSGTDVQFLPPPYWGPYPGGGLLQPGQTHNFGFMATGTGTFIVLPQVVCTRAG